LAESFIALFAPVAANDLRNSAQKENAGRRPGTSFF
jgi:hypothetical protein